MATFNFDTALKLAADHPTVLAYLMANRGPLERLGVSVWLEVKALVTAQKEQQAVERLNASLQWLALEDKAAGDVAATADVAARTKAAVDDLSELALSAAKGLVSALAAALVI